MVEPSRVRPTCLKKRWVCVRIGFDGFYGENLSVERESQVGVLAMMGED